ncbi:hypothetical protein HYT55_00200 [Candidatus Woesearchaeota archaeon]|nr:hypothetical protein [Candidatus Woesearchaeota archaeon]
MTKLQINLITTDYDWFSDIAQRAKNIFDRDRSELLRIMQEDSPHFPVMDIMNRLEYLPQEPGQFWEEMNARFVGPFAPYIEFRLHAITISPSESRGFFLQRRSFEYERLKSTILLEDDDIKSSSFRRRLPPGTTHIPWLFNFVSNCGYYDSLFQDLDRDFDVNRVDVLYFFNQ